MITDLAVLSCAICFGDPGDPLAKGAVAGVLVLGGVIVAVLFWITLLARFWIKRAADMREGALSPESDTSLR